MTATPITALVVESAGRGAETGKWPAPAKINLFLHIGGRRPDGFHCLQSLVVFTELADRISVSRSRELSLTITGPFAAGLAADQGNLVLRAAHLLGQAAGIEARAHIRLEKALPVAAGIGGGSADAAATLRALRDLWRVPIDDAALAKLAAQLGADVPVCLGHQPSLMSGIGQDVAAGPALPPFALLLANPGKPLGTREVFNQPRRGVRLLRGHRCWTQKRIGNLAQALGPTCNDLEPAALELVPEIGDVLSDLAALPRCRLARMSGSGATCFGLFDELSQAQAAAAHLAAARPGWWVRATAVRGLG